MGGCRPPQTLDARLERDDQTGIMKRVHIGPGRLAPGGQPKGTQVRVGLALGFLFVGAGGCDQGGVQSFFFGGVHHCRYFW